MNPERIIEISQAHPTTANIEGIRQENCDIAMNMLESDVQWLNWILKQKYSPEDDDQPIKEDKEIKQEEN